MHGGQAIGKRNTEGERVLEFAFADELVGNIWFKKEPKHLVTYQSGNAATQIDFKFEVGITESQEKPHFIGYQNFINDLTKLVSSQTLAHVQLRVCLKY